MGFWRDLFTLPSKKVWPQVARELEAQFVNGGFWKTDQIILDYKAWQIQLDTFNVDKAILTRMRAFFLWKKQLEFKLREHHLLTNVFKAMGMEDIEVGYPDFDAKYVIKGSDRNLIRRLLMERQLRDTCFRIPELLLLTKLKRDWPDKPFPPGAGQLYFQRAGVMKQPDQIKDLFCLFQLVLERLMEIGVIKDGAME